MEIDIGDLCTHCGRDTSFGSVDENGEKLLLFVNRIPSGANGKLLLQRGQEVLEEESDIDGNLLLDTLIDVEVDGYMCPDCQCIECDECGELTLEYEWMNMGGFLFDQEDPIRLCPDCMEKREVANE